MLSIILYNLWILTRVEVQGTAITVYFFKNIVKNGNNKRTGLLNKKLNKLT